MLEKITKPYQEGARVQEQTNNNEIPEPSPTLPPYPSFWLHSLRATPRLALNHPLNLVLEKNTKT
jgi:hypothetical protein